MSYTDAELEQMMLAIESDLVERKESLNGDAPTTVREAICAFANDLPDHRRSGVVFVGVRNDGTPRGLAITDDLLLQLASMKTEGNIVPPPSMIVEKRALRGRMSPSLRCCQPMFLRSVTGAAFGLSRPASRYRDPSRRTNP